jgi:hypothetical protein
MTIDHSPRREREKKAAEESGRSADFAVLLVTDELQTIRKTLAYLRAQTIRDHIQIVVGVPADSDVSADAPDFDGFADVRLVEVPAASVRDARAATLRGATAPIVAVGETHAFPRPDYAEKLVEAHQGPWAAVGPAMENANPSSVISWVELFMSYGPWFEPRRGVANDLPGHNSSYKRRILLELGNRLEEVIGHSTSLHPELRAHGHELYVEPAARVDHLNPTLWRSYFALAFQAGRLYGALRSAEWALTRRTVYIAGSPLIPAVRLWKIVRGASRSTRGRAVILRVVPALVPMLVSNAAGEVSGYLFGPGRTDVLDDAELHRTRYVRSAERLREEDESTWPTSGSIRRTNEPPAGRHLSG